MVNSSLKNICQHKDEDEGSKCVLKWTPTSSKLFEKTEENMYKVLKNDHEMKFVEVSNKYVIRTIKIGTFDDKQHAPLVLIHGFAAGSAFWVLNIDALSSNRNVYAIDLLGFGRSSRPTFPTDPQEVDDLFVNTIEDWRQQMRIEKFILLGHSFGGYISSLYALKHEDRILHLLLDDPWGFPAVPPPGEGPFGNAPKWKKAVFNVLTSINPMSALRMAGPFGPSLVARMRPDIIAKYACLYGEEHNIMAEYMFHCNAQTASGEAAFANVAEKMIYAKNPLVHRLKSIKDTLPITIITGTESWVQKISDFGMIQDVLSDKQLVVRLIEDAGHHVHADQAVEFNEFVNWICEHVQSIYKITNDKTMVGLETSI